MMTDDEHKRDDEETEDADAGVSDEALDDVFDAEDEDEGDEGDVDPDDKSAFGDDGMDE